MWFFSESLSLTVHYHSLLSAKNFVLRVLTLALSLAAWVTSGKSFSPGFLLSERILPVDPNSPSLSLLNGQKGIIHTNMHAAASCYKVWDRCYKSLFKSFPQPARLGVFYLPCHWNLRPLWSWPAFLWTLKRSHWELWPSGQNPHIWTGLARPEFNICVLGS